MKNLGRTCLFIFMLCIPIASLAVPNQLAIHFSGVSGKVNDNVKQALANLRNEVRHPLSPSSIQAFYSKAPRVIKSAIEPYGFFRARIQKSLTRNKNIWTANFNIIPGAAIRISEVDLKITGPGIHDRAFERLHERFPLKAGHVLHTEEYEKAKQLLYDIASTRGYFKAKMLKSKIYINLISYRARIVFQFETGPRYFFGYTVFSDTPFDPRFLEKFLAYREGERYNYRKIQKTQTDLINSNYFDQTIVHPVPKEAIGREVPINIELTPRKRFQYDLGLGYGTDTGPRGTLGFTVRRINATGHRFHTLIQASQKYSNATASYLIPGANPITDLYTFSAGYADFDQVTGSGTSRKVSAKYTTAFGDWQQTFALTYLNERYNIRSFPFTKSEVTYPSTSWQYINTKNILKAKYGFRFSGFIAGTPKSGISKTAFSQIRVDLKLVTNLFKHTRILMRTSMGHTDIRNLENLPFSLQFFAGGAQSIRGYRYNAIGPGRNLFTGSVEIQQRIKGDWYLAAFFDVGNVTDGNPFNSNKWFEGVGPGIVWVSPIGMLEVTVANAINQPNHPWLVQFTMGPAL